MFSRGSPKASRPRPPCYFAWGCFRYFSREREPRRREKRTSRGHRVFVDVSSTRPRTQSAGVDVLLRQKSICDNQSHHARENQQGREEFSDHWPDRIARSRWSGLRFIALCRWFASLRFRRRAHASHLAVISAVDLANGQHRGLGFAHHLESGSIVSQELLRV